MLGFQRIEPLPHIEIQREPDEPAIRPRGGIPPKPQPRDDPGAHAAHLNRLAAEATLEVMKVRQGLGIDPSRLLVLQFRTLEADQREKLERLNLTILEEVEAQKGPPKVFRILVQFLDQKSLEDFREECDRYGTGSLASGALPRVQRRDLFDSLDDISPVSREQRTGRRLGQEGPPVDELFYLDVDLWHPGNVQKRIEVERGFREFVQRLGGEVVGTPLAIPSLILFKVRSNRNLLNTLLDYDLVSLVDLPPRALPEEDFDLRMPIDVPGSLPEVPSGGPKACIVDSGVVAGHPLLTGTIIEEHDFGSGEPSAADRNGHGTGVAGIVVYGNIAQRAVDGAWDPQVAICSAKVLRHRPTNPANPAEGGAEFAEEERAEELLGQAIEYYHRTRAIRVFNVSIGHAGRLFAGGRQFPWAELLDELARRLDIVIVVSAGNAPLTNLPPTAIHTQHFQRQVLEGLQAEECRLIDPATAALCLTVGSIARRDDPATALRAAKFAAVPKGCPSPFTRCGPGVAGAVKPELAHYGGNYAVDSIGAPMWVRNEPNLGEPTLAHNFVSLRLLKEVLGTSYAAAQVTHIAARAEAALREYLGRPPSANLIRALVVASARVDKDVRELLGGAQETVLRTVGFGCPSIDACWSTPNRVTLLAQDEVAYKTFHIYELRIPPSFLDTKGHRSITVSLAYDPPARLSRKEYIACSMWLDIYRGLTTEQVFECRAKYVGDGDPPKVADRYKLDFKPAGQTLRHSTVQARRLDSSQAARASYSPADGEDPRIQIFLGCQPHFPSPSGEEQQRYALVVMLEHENEQLNLYQEVRAKVRSRARVRL